MKFLDDSIIIIDIDWLNDINIELYLSTIDIVLESKAVSNFGKNYRPLIFLIILVFAVIFTNNNAFAQILHNMTIYKMVNQSLDAVINSKIDVGEAPKAIAFNKFTNTIYVVNFGSDTVSVISGKNNTKIADIPVGNGPIAIAVEEFTNTIYVVKNM